MKQITVAEGTGVPVSTHCSGAQCQWGPTLALLSFSCCTRVARSARSFSRAVTLVRITLISCTTCAAQDHLQKSLRAAIAAFYQGERSALA